MVAANLKALYSDNSYDLATVIYFDTTLKKNSRFGSRVAHPDLDGEVSGQIWILIFYTKVVYISKKAGCLKQGRCQSFGQGGASWRAK